MRRLTFVTGMGGLGTKELLVRQSGETDAGGFLVPSGVGSSERNGFEHEDWSRALHLFLVQDRVNLINLRGAELFCGRLPNVLLRHGKVLTCT